MEAVTGHLKQRVVELEKQKERLVQSCEAARRELSSRNEERRQFQLQLDNLTTELAKSQMMLEQANLQLEQFQDKSDKKIHDKNEQLQRQQVALEARDSEIQMLRQQLVSQGPGTGMGPGYLEQTQQRVVELEKQKEQVGQSCEAAMRELSSRNEECRQFQLQLNNLMAELAKSQVMLEQANLQLEQFQDKSDKKIHDKNEQLQRQQVALEARDSEIQMLRQQLVSQGPGTGMGPGYLEQRVVELEKQKEQLEQSCEAAMKELSSRNEECRQFQLRLDSIMTELGRLQSECRASASASEELAKSQMMLEQANLEFEQFQDKSDKKVYDKNEELQRQQVVLEARDSEIQTLRQELARVREENGLLQRTVGQLRGNVDQSVESEGSARICPVCAMKLPGHIDQAEFERHVQSHFD